MCFIKSTRAGSGWHSCWPFPPLLSEQGLSHVLRAAVRREPCRCTQTLGFRERVLRGVHTSNASGLVVAIWRMGSERPKVQTRVTQRRVHAPSLQFMTLSSGFTQIQDQTSVLSQEELLSVPLMTTGMIGAHSATCEFGLGTPRKHKHLFISSWEASLSPLPGRCCWGDGEWWLWYFCW